jgi:hypothetical protein
VPRRARWGRRFCGSGHADQIAGWWVAFQEVDISESTLYYTRH